MNLTIAGPNLPNSKHPETFHVHAAGCPDLKRVPYSRLGSDSNLLTSAYASVQEVVEETYSDIIAENEGDLASWEAYETDFWFAPCTDLMPRTEAEAEDRVALRKADLRAMRVAEWSREAECLDPMADFVKAMERYSTDLTQGLGWNVQPLMEAAARRRHLLLLVHLLSSPEGYTTEAAVVIWVRELTKVVTQEARYPSRSSSTQSNEVATVIASEAAKLIEEASWIAS